MTNTNRIHTAADALATLTADAYSFSYYGAKNWRACVELLFSRGYNAIEADAILRSAMTRYATDNITTRRKANAADLADLMDHRMGGAAALREFIDETVLAICQPEVEKLDSREALHLVWSR